MDFNYVLNSILDFLSSQEKGWTVCSVPFMAIFVVFFVGYIIISNKTPILCKIYVLLFSLFFAFKANGALFVILIFTTILSWLLTPKITILRRGKIRKIGLSIIILIELIPLLYFKYTNFSIELLNQIFITNLHPLNIILPIGISFYTFQAISYTVDTYKGYFKKPIQLLDYIFYLTFFPLLIAGPIVRAKDFLPQIQKPKFNNYLLLNKGVWLISIGIIKKAIIANYLAQYNDWIFTSPMNYSGFETLLAVFGYALQIYCDFSGYSDIAIGLSALMGFKLKQNFNFPYKSLNLTEFWHRWHISLSSWFKDYVYIPLGGNRKAIYRIGINIFITMIVAGLWHGASNMFLIWGLLHGIGLIIHKLLLQKIPNLFSNYLWFKILSWGITFLYVSFAWIFFRSPNISTVFSIIDNIIYNFSISDFYPFLMTRPLYLILLVICLELLAVREGDYKWIENKFINANWIFKLLLFIVIIQAAINFSQNNIQPFIYSQF